MCTYIYIYIYIHTSLSLRRRKELRSVFIISNRKTSNRASQILKANTLLVCPYCLEFQIAIIMEAPELHKLKFFEILTNTQITSLKFFEAPERARAACCLRAAQARAKGDRHVYVYVCICVCVCIYIYIYIYIHTHIHTNTEGYIYIYIYIYIYKLSTLYLHYAKGDRWTCCFRASFSGSSGSTCNTPRYIYIYIYIYMYIHTYIYIYIYINK